MKIYVYGKSEISPIATPIYGMAVIDKNLSGLPYDIWLDPAASNRNMRHNSPRLKVVVDGERIPYIISDNPRQAVGTRKKVKHEADIIAWIIQNKEVLLKQWNNEISDKEALDKVERLK